MTELKSFTALAFKGVAESVRRHAEVLQVRLGVRRLFALLALVTMWSWSVAAVAQEEQEERSRFIRFVERQISTPDRQIRLGHIEGALSSDVRIEDITIADREGVWLRIEDVRLIWSRRALLSRRLEIELLEAERIAVTRAPLPAEGASEPFEEPDFQLPKLPVVLYVDAVRVPQVEIAPGVLSAQDYELSVAGSVELDGGALDADLDIVRTDRLGALALEAAFSNETRVLELDFLLTEPENGIVANLLNLEGRPAVTFAITGVGPIANFVADIALTADGEELLAGEAEISRTTAGRFRFLADVGGDLQRLVPPLYRELVEAGSRLKIDATRAEDGAIDIAEAELRSGAALLEFSGGLTADGSPLALDLQATLDAPGDTPIHLPGGGGEWTVQYGRITARLDGEAWSAGFDLRGLATPMLSADAATVDAEGTATDLGGPAARQVSFTLDGTVRGLGSGDPDLSAALGETLGLQAAGAWAAGETVQITKSELESPNASLGFIGTVDADGATGDFAVTLPELAHFSGLAGRPLAGSMTLAATGSAQFSGERLALTLDGEAQDLDLGVAPLGALLHGRATLSGAISRDQAGLRFDAFMIESPQLSLTADGGPIGPDSKINATMEIADLTAIVEGASGALTLTAAVTGTPAAAGVDAVLEGEDLVLAGRPIDGATGRFIGTVAGTRVNGSLTARGTLDGLVLEASAGIMTDPDGRRVLQDLQVTAGDSRLSGELALLPQALLEGRLALQSEEVATLAPLLLTPASGAVTAEIALSSEDGAQAAAITAEIDNLDIEAAGGIAVSSATADLSVTGLFDAPPISGTVSSADVQIGDFVLPSLTLVSTREGDASTWYLSAELADGTLTSSGRLQREDAVYLVSVDTLQVSGDDVEADLAVPLNMRIGDGRATVEGGVLVVGEGRIAFSGDFGAGRTARAQFDALPLGILNAFVGDLAASGMLSGTVSTSGSAAAPAITFDLRANDISFALLDLVGLEPLAAEAQGHYEGGTLTVDADARVKGHLVTLRGDIGDKLDVTLGAAAVQLALLDDVVPQLGLGGTVSAELHVTGSLAAPEASFNVTGSDLTAAPLRALGVPGLGLEADGEIRGNSVALSQAVVRVGEGRIAFSGTAGEMLDLAYDIGGLPLSLAAGLVPGLGLEGQISGTGTVDGAVLDPRVTFDVQGREIATAQLRQAGLPVVGLDVEGVFAEGVAALDRVVATIGEGRIELAGTAGAELDLNATVADVSLALADVFLPVALEGELSGSAEIRGFLLDPVASFDLEAPALTTPVLRAEGMPTMALAVQGNYASGSVTVEEAALTVGEGRMAATGALGAEIDANVTASAVPLWIMDAVLPDLELQGTVSGSASAQGAPSALRAQFDLQATRVSAAPLAAAGLGPAEATVAGSYGDGALVLQTARIVTAQGLAELKGRVANRLDLTLSLEDFPAAIANALGPGLDLAGVVSGTLRATGPAEDPILNFDLRGAGIRGEPLRTVPVP